MRIIKKNYLAIFGVVVIVLIAWFLTNSDTSNLTNTTRNLKLEQIFVNSQDLPDYHTVFIPTLKRICTKDDCNVVEPKVFNLLGGTSSNPTFSRCDTQGCDTYDASLDVSGNYKNIQPNTPRGMFLKMSYNTTNKEYIEVVALGLETYTSYGYAMYDFEYTKLFK